MYPSCTLGVELDHVRSGLYRHVIRASWQTGLVLGVLFIVSFIVL